MMIPSARILSHQVIYRDEYSYCAHPHIAALQNGRWVVVFNRTGRRPFLLHPPEDPHYYNVAVWSDDLGKTWNKPRVVPGYDWYGVECAGLTPLRDGSLLLNQWRFNWYPLEKARKMEPDPWMVFPEDYICWMKGSHELDIGEPLPDPSPELFPWARTNGGAYTHLSTDQGETWEQTAEIVTKPYCGGYGMRGGVQLINGDILLPLSDVPNYKTVFVVCSKDGGKSWGTPIEAAGGADVFFEEPTILQIQDGRILMVLRENNSHFLYQVTSSDDGHTWSAPRQMPVWGYPAHLLALADGRILCVYGYRAAPYGIRAVISYDNGDSWDIDQLLVIRDDLPNRDLGYPGSVLLEDGSVFTVYYGEDQDGVTCIMGTHFTLTETE